MALGISRDRSTNSESINRGNEIDLTAKTASQEETSKPDGTSQIQETADIEKQVAASRNFAMSKRSDSKMQALSQQALLQNQLSTYTPNSNTQVLGKTDDAAKGSAVSQQYAQQKDEGLQVANPNRYESIRNEIAGALGTNSDDPAVDQTYAELIVKQNETREAEKLKDAQAIIDAARTFGRRIEGPTRLGITPFQEFIPGEWKENIGDTPVFLRSGTDTIMGDEIIRHVRYFEPGKLGGPVGWVESVIKDGKETITAVGENIKGAIGLKPGDTRDVPPPQTTPAGKVPSSFDPQPDGRYGSAGKPSTPDSGNTTSGDAKPQQTTGTEGGRFHEVFIGGGSNDAQSTDTMEPATNSGAENNSTQPSSDDAKTEGAPATHTEHKGGSETATNTDGQWEQGPSVQTFTPPTEVTVEKPETTDDNDGAQAPYGDYADLGPAPAPQNGSRSIEAQVSQRSSNRSFATIIPSPEGYADRPGAPIDYGDPADPHASEAPAGDSTKPGMDPTVTDPANPGEDGGEMAALDVGSIRMDMIGTLRDGVNPMDPFAQDAPAADRPKTSDAERTSSLDDSL